MKQYYSHGKLLLTGEYLVLDGALALAVPTHQGQYLTVDETDKPRISWISLDINNKPWFTAEFDLDTNSRVKLLTENNPIANQLLNLLQKAQDQNPDFLTTSSGYNLTASLEFPNNWGLGSSSTLINNLATWANINPYTLSEVTFGGSGYDIACTQVNSPITYSIKSDGTRDIKNVAFNPVFKDHLYFIHLNRKQNSRDGIHKYNMQKQNIQDAIQRINDITRRFLICDSLNEFTALLNVHEQVISEIIQSPTIQSELFDDFKGSIKSLGAWGGDFVLVASNDDPTSYFKRKGYHTIVRYEDMVLTSI